MCVCLCICMRTYKCVYIIKNIKLPCSVLSLKNETNALVARNRNTSYLDFLVEMNRVKK